MEQRAFGNTRRMVPVIGQGTWYGTRDRREAAVAALRRGIELGMTHIDTAEMYLSGRAEEWVAEAIEGRRDEVFVVSKVLPENASRAGTVRACDGSLKRLRTDRLDCYLLHWIGGRHPVAETIAAFEELREAGKILSWGVSNFDAHDLEEAYRVGSGPVCNQVLYHLKERAVEHAVLPWCSVHEAALVGYSPFGHDDFPDHGVLREVAGECGATPRQVALRFLVRDPACFTIPKASDLRHVEENAAAGSLELSEEQIGRIERAFPRGPKPRTLPML